MSSPRHRNQFSVLRTLAGVAAVGITTFVVFQLHLNFAAAGFLELLLVMVIAVEAGFWEATVASLVANLFLDLFFVPPLFHFEVNDAQNWIALIAFELTKATRQLSLLNLEGSGSAELARLIKRTLLADSVVFFDGAKDGTNHACKEDQQLEAEPEAHTSVKRTSPAPPFTYMSGFFFGVLNLSVP